MAGRLYNGSKEQMDYDNVATTVFSPLEYGCVGLTEEEAISRYTENNIEVCFIFRLCTQGIEKTSEYNFLFTFRNYLTNNIVIPILWIP